jgi:hypothetical protein
MEFEMIDAFALPAPPALRGIDLSWLRRDVGLPLAADAVKVLAAHGVIPVNVMSAAMTRLAGVDALARIVGVAPQAESPWASFWANAGSPPRRRQEQVHLSEETCEAIGAVVARRLLEVPAV